MAKTMATRRAFSSPSISNDLFSPPTGSTARIFKPFHASTDRARTSLVSCLEMAAVRKAATGAAEPRPSTEAPQAPQKRIVSVTGPPQLPQNIEPPLIAGVSRSRRVGPIEHVLADSDLGVARCDPQAFVNQKPVTAPDLPKQMPDIAFACVRSGRVASPARQSDALF